jgi:ribosome-binding protein aMBF1 (putative translation factor)
MISNEEDNICEMCGENDKTIFNEGDTTIYVCEHCSAVQTFVDCRSVTITYKM